MNEAKEKYLNGIRSNTAYPTYRSIIGIITVLGYCLAIITVLGTLISGFGTMRYSFIGGSLTLIGGLLGAALIFFLAKFWKEASLILADIGDSVTDANSINSSL